MTEPVAYLSKYLDNSTNITRYKPENQRLLSSKPLYIAEQLHPRVKMTQAEFDEFRAIYEQCSSVYVAMDRIFKRHKAFPFLNKKIALSGCLDEQLSNQFAKVFLNFDPEHPEETIEIITEKKWFVRSKKPDSDGDWQFLNGIDEPNDWGYSHNEEDTNNPRNIAYPFDTKERAEEWKNPITEVVLLPIGDE